MKFGLYAINYGTCADPDSLVRVAQHSEAAGLASLWAGEHIVLPSPQPPDYAIAPEIPFLDAVVALALAAANTTSITVATGILELPLHQPVLLAKQLPRPGVRRAGRAARRARHPHRRAPGGDAGALDDGRAGVPRPARRVRRRRRPPPPGPGRRAARHDRRQQRAGPSAGIQPRALDEDLDRLERPASLGPFDFTVISPKNRLDRGLVDAQLAVGVDQLIVLPGLDVPTDRRYHAVPIDDIFRTIDHLAELAHE